MPGLLPMKVIKVGSSAQCRVAQACDRCRSKKIRCDGVTPCCSQCANVGFECKTSDKLSRRAFPRGYTESLEERVRSLESENRELKDLLDAKDDKIDILSRIHSNSPPKKRPSSTFSYATSSTSRTSSVDPHSVAEEQQSPPASSASEDIVLPLASSASASCGKQFVEALKGRVRDGSSQSASFKTQPFFAPKGRNSEDATAPDFRIPSRMASDQLINIYIQEWSPLFPIIHRPRILKLYADFSTDPESLQSADEFAQIYLIFAIAAISAKWNNHDHRTFETKWQTALDTAVKDVSVSALQCLLLAQVYCAASGDLEKLRRYKTMAVKLSRRLGLYQSQKRVSLGPLVTETRKRLFWTMFTLDCLSAAMLGQTRMLGDLDIACEMPLDVDDEDVTEEAFLTPAPGNATRFSSALAMMQGSLVMADVLDRIYPSTAIKHIALNDVGALSDKLDTWFQGLAPHLRLSFLQDKPSTSVSGSRSPFLSLMYNHIRSLLHRPLVLSGNASQRSSSLVKLAQSSKYIIQIIQLLNERRMSFSFPLEKRNTIVLAGFGLLYQVADLKRECKLVQDSQKQLSVVVSLLESEEAPEVSEFKKASLATIKLLSLRSHAQVEEDKGSSERSKVSGDMPAPKSVSSASRHRLQSSPRKMTAAELARSPRIKQEAMSSPQFATPFPTSRSTQDHFSLDDSGPKMGYVAHRPHSFPIISRSQANDLSSLPNLDYLDFNKEPADLKMTQLNMANNGGIGSQQANLNTFASPNLFSYMSEDSNLTNPSEWSTDLWSMSDDPCWQSQAGALSLSEEDLTSGEELSSCGASSHFPSATFSSTGDLTALDGFTAGFGV